MKADSIEKSQAGRAADLKRKYKQNRGKKSPRPFPVCPEVAAGSRTQEARLAAGARELWKPGIAAAHFHEKKSSRRLQLRNRQTGLLFQI